MRGRGWAGAIGFVVVLLGVVTGWVSGGEASPQSDRGRCLSLRLLPLDEWGFGREAHAPVPIPLPSGVVVNPAPATLNSAQRRFRITVPATEKKSGPGSEQNETAFYVRVGTAPKAAPGNAVQTAASLNASFLQNQMRRQTQMLLAFQGRLNELQSLLRKTAAAMRPPQKRVMEMETGMLQAQIAALQQAQGMTLQALAHTPHGPRYLQMMLSPTVVVSETLLSRLATEGETVRLGPVALARTVRVRVEALR